MKKIRNVGSATKKKRSDGILNKMIVTFLTSDTMTMVVVKLSKTADMKNVIKPTTHIKSLFFFDVMTSVTTLKPAFSSWIFIISVSAHITTHI